MSDSNNTTKDPNFLGSGTYGCAYDPPIQCEDGETPENSISKVMKGNNAKREFKEYDIVRDTDPEGIYTIGALRICKPELSNKKLQDYLKETCTPIQKSKLDDLSMLLLENGGMDLDRYIREVINKMDNQQERALETKRLFVRFIDILNGVDLFTMNEVSHRDIKLQNVVFNKDTGRTKFIDFGMMTTFEGIVKEASANDYFLGKQPHWSTAFVCLAFDKIIFDKVREKWGQGNWKERQLVGLGKFLNEGIATGLSRYNGLPKAFVVRIMNSFAETMDDIVIEKKGYREFLYRSSNIIDLYGVGIMLLQVLATLDYLPDIADEHPTFWRDIFEFMTEIMSQNVFHHITSQQAVEKYHRLLEHYNLYQDTGLEYAHTKGIIQEIAPKIEETSGVDSEEAVTTDEEVTADEKSSSTSVTEPNLNNIESYEENNPNTPLKPIDLQNKTTESDLSDLTDNMLPLDIESYEESNPNTPLKPIDLQNKTTKSDLSILTDNLKNMNISDDESLDTTKPQKDSFDTKLSAITNNMNNMKIADTESFETADSKLTNNTVNTDETWRTVRGSGKTRRNRHARKNVSRRST